MSWRRRSESNGDFTDASINILICWEKYADFTGVSSTCFVLDVKKFYHPADTVVTRSLKVFSEGFCRCSTANNKMVFMPTWREDFDKRGRIVSRGRFARKAWSRALFLHQISMEECANVDVLMGGVTGLLMGHKVDFKKVADVFRKHERKNKVNAYFLEPSAAERAAQEASRTADSVAAFELIQEQFHERSNLEKNAALYVDLQDEDFKTPVERITPKMVARLGKINEKFLFMTVSETGASTKVRAGPGQIPEVGH